MSRPFISVVMPVYGVEAYLEESVKSVLAQTEPSFEIILVDDCSPDNCPKICDQLAKQDERISVLHLEKNVGASEARNAGYNRAIGEKVFFMDADDTIDADLFRSVKAAEEKNASQVILFGIKEQYYDKNDSLVNQVEILYGKELYITEKSVVRKETIELEKKTFLGYPWNKIYSIDYLKEINVRFESFALLEDLFFNVKVFRELQFLTILNYAFYHYKKRNNASLTTKFVPDYYWLHEKKIQELYSLYNEWDMLDSYVKNILANLYVRYIFSALQRNCDRRANMNREARKRFLVDIYKKDIFIELMPYAQSEHSSVGIMCKTLKKRRTRCALALGRLIYIIKDKLPILFSRLKQKK